MLYFGVHLQYLLKILVENVHNNFMFESYYVTLFIKVCTNINLTDLFIKEIYIRD